MVVEDQRRIGVQRAHEVIAGLELPAARHLGGGGQHLGGPDPLPGQVGAEQEGDLGLDARGLGLAVTLALLSSAVLTVAVRRPAQRWGPRTALLGLATLIVLSALLFLTARNPWLVVVAAEMIAGRDGLGFAVWDARNGLRIDLLAAAMFAIGIIGAALDRLLVQLTRIPSVRWGYER